jgi:hypothetical protein
VTPAISLRGIGKKYRISPGGVRQASIKPARLTVVILNRKALVAVAQEFFERYNRRPAACFRSPVQTPENNLNVPRTPRS